MWIFVRDPNGARLRRQTVRLPRAGATGTRATIEVPARLVAAGPHRVRVRYLGSAKVAPARKVSRLRVRP